MGSLEFRLFRNLVSLGDRVRARADVEAKIVGGSRRIVVLVLHVDGHTFRVEHFDVQDRDCISLSSTLKDSGMPAGGRLSPFTMAP